MKLQFNLKVLISKTKSSKEYLMLVVQKLFQKKSMEYLVTEQF